MGNARSACTASLLLHTYRGGGADLAESMRFGGDGYHLARLYAHTQRAHHPLLIRSVIALQHLLV